MGLAGTRERSEALARVVHSALGHVRRTECDHLIMSVLPLSLFFMLAGVLSDTSVGSWAHLFDFRWPRRRYSKNGVWMGVYWGASSWPLA